MAAGTTDVRPPAAPGAVVDFASAVRATLTDLRARVGLEGWAVVRLLGEEQVVLAVVADGPDSTDGSSGHASGGHLETSIDAEPWGCAALSRTLGAGEPVVVLDAAASGEVLAHRARSWVSAPVLAPDGELLGALCGAGSAPRDHHLLEALPTLRLSADLLGVLLAHELRLMEVERRAERAEDAAHTDGLTGLANRRAWDSALAAESARADRYATATSVVVLDVDGLKELNDRQGHPAGDELLRRTAAVLRQGLRGADLAARLGGDEFGVVLPVTDAAAARGLVARLRERVGAAGVAVSVGVATGRAGEDLGLVWAQADAAMYQDKAHRASHRAAARAGAAPLPAGPEAARPGAPEPGPPAPADSIDALLRLVRDRLGLQVALVDHVELDLRSSAGVPVHRTDGTLYGTLCATPRRPERGLGARDLAVLEAVAGIVVVLAEHEDRRGHEHHELLGALDALADDGGPRIAYQPIVALADLSVVGVEALARFPAGTRPPEEWFTAASAVGAGIDLELAAMGAALRELDAVPGYLSLNASAPTVRSPAFARLLACAPLPRVVLELTEHAAVDDYPALLAALRPLRERGLRLAVDDAGAGFASLRHVLALVPDLVKLDASLVRGLDADPAREALAAALVTFAARTGTELVAEGVETAEELAALRAVGIRYAQGHHLGAPAPLHALATRRAPA